MKYTYVNKILTQFLCCYFLFLEIFMGDLKKITYMTIYEHLAR